MVVGAGLVPARAQPETGRATTRVAPTIALNNQRIYMKHGICKSFIGAGRF